MDMERDRAVQEARHQAKVAGPDGGWRDTASRVFGDCNEAAVCASFSVVGRGEWWGCVVAVGCAAPCFGHEEVQA